MLPRGHLMLSTSRDDPTVSNGTAGTSDGASHSAVCAAERKVVQLKLYFFAGSLPPQNHLVLCQVSHTVTKNRSAVHVKNLH